MRGYRVAAVLTAAIISFVIAAGRMFSWSLPTSATSQDDRQVPANCLKCADSGVAANVGASVSQLAELAGAAVDRHKLQTLFSQGLPAEFSLREIVSTAAPTGLELGEVEVLETENPAGVPFLTVDKTGTYVVASTSTDRSEFCLWSPNGEVFRLLTDDYRKRFGSRGLAIATGVSNAPTSLVINSHYADEPVKGTVGEIRYFTVFNPGEAEVEVRSVASTCPCAEARLSPLLIPPKGAATLRIETRTPVEEGIEFASWPIVLEVGTPRPASQFFALKAKVQRPVIVSPPAYHFEKLPEGFGTKKLVFTAKIVDPTGHVDLAPLHLDDGLRWGGSTNTNQASQAVVYLESSALTTRSDRQFSLHAVLYDRAHPKHRWTVAVNGTVCRPLEFLPKEVFLGNVAPGERVSRSVMLRNASKAQPIAEIAEPDRVSATFRAETVQLDFTAPEEVGAFRYRLFIHADGNPAELPISGIVTARSESAEVLPTIATEPR